MKLAKAMLGTALVLGGAVGGAFAQHQHPNISEAQHLIEQAVQRITTAQKDNHYDMQGHAERAKQLLQQAEQELTMASQVADNPGRRK